MSQSNPITIQGWQKGVATSPYVGFGKMVGLDIYNRPGAIQAGLRLLNNGKTYSGFPTAQVLDKSGAIYVGTIDGKIYRNGALVSAWSTTAAIHDLVIVQDCLLIFNSDTTINLVTNLSGGATYVANWKTDLETSVFGWKKAFLGQDNVIYFGNETKLGSLVNFTPTPTVNPTSATADLNTSCISTSLPNDRIVQTICEQNRYVAISTSKTGNGYGNTKLYFMDRGTLDGSQTSFNLSIGVDIPERYVRQMITQDNRLYFFGTDTGTFYTSNTTTYSVVTVLPMRLPIQSYNTAYPTTPNSVALVNNEILFGIGGAFNSAFDIVYGVYSLRGNAIVCKQILANGEYGQTQAVSIGAICVTGNGAYDVGWQTGSSVGVDSASYYIGTGFNCWFESPFYETGTSIKPRTFQTIQFNTGNVLVSGQGLKLYYRQGSQSAWTLYATYSYSGTTLTMTYADGTSTSQTGSFNSFNSKFPITFTTNLQIKVAFDTGTSAVYGTNIELQSIILI